MCKKTVLPLTLAKWGFEVSNGDSVNMKVVEYKEIDQMELKHEFSEYWMIPHVHAKSLQRVPLINKALKSP